MTYVIASPEPTSGNNVWSISNLPPGVTSTIQVYVNVASVLPVSTVLTNTVRVGGPKLATAVFTATTSANSVPDVKISKLDSADPVRVGDVILYTIQYRNDGTAPVNGVRITETYPSKVTFLSANPAPDIGNNIWLTDTLDAGDFHLIFVSVQVNNPIPDLTILSNTITIDSNETAPFSANEVTLVRSPALTLTKSASSATPAANSPLTYTLRYTNTGTTHASSVVVTDAVPANTTYLSCAPGAACSQFGGTVTWNLGDVLSQTGGLLTMTVDVNNNLDNGTRITNTARIVASAENVSAFVRITQTVTSAPVLGLAKSDGRPSAAANDVLTYTLAYSNAGNARAQNVVITDRIPSNVIFVNCLPACTAMGGGVYSFTTPGTVNAGADGAVTLTVRVSPTLPAGLRAITNTARIRTTTAGDDPANNLAQDVDDISTVPVLDLGVAFTSTTPYPTKIITYTLRYTNTSDMDTTGVVVSATKSPYVSYVPSGSSVWTFAGGDVYTYSVGNLAARASGVLTYIVNLPYPFTAEMEAFTNTFAMQDDGPGGITVSTDITNTLLGVPDLVIQSVSVSPGSVTYGTKFTATVVLRNEGTGVACNPKNGCGAFTLDLFYDPSPVPPSLGFTGYGDPYGVVSPLGPGMTTTKVFANLSFTGTQDFILYFKVDNWDCANGTPCIPDYANHGLVPESDELNNVYGPVVLSDALSNRIYIPLVLKNH